MNPSLNPSESAAPPIQKQVSAKKGKKATPIPESIKVYQDLASRFPPKGLWSKIAGTVGEEVAGLERWREVVTAWLGCGWNPANVAGMLEYFERRETPSTSGGQHANRANLKQGIQTGIAGLRERGLDNPIKKRFNVKTGETYWIDIRTGERVPNPGLP